MDRRHAARREQATGIQQVLDAHGIQASEMMAFGDSMNDYEILRMAGTSVAMGNARSAIKQIATKVIGTNVDRSVQRGSFTPCWRARGRTV